MCLSSFPDEHVNPPSSISSHAIFRLSETSCPFSSSLILVIIQAHLETHCIVFFQMTCVSSQHMLRSLRNLVFSRFRLCHIISSEFFCSNDVDVSLLFSLCMRDHLKIIEWRFQHNAFIIVAALKCMMLIVSDCEDAKARERLGKDVRTINPKTAGRLQTVRGATRDSHVRGLNRNERDPRLSFPLPLLLSPLVHHQGVTFFHFIS